MLIQFPLKFKLNTPVIETKRIYTKEVFQNAFNKNLPKIVVSDIGDDTVLDLNNVVGSCESMEIKGDYVMFNIELHENTEFYKLFKLAPIIRVEIEPIGIGQVDEKMNVFDYELLYLKLIPSTQVNMNVQ